MVASSLTESSLCNLLLDKAQGRFQDHAAAESMV
jgi:hypothetical protein